MEPASRQRQDTDDLLVSELERGIRQRRAQLAARQEAGGGRELSDLEATQFVEEPVPFSARPLLGPVVVAARKAVAVLFLRWYTRPVLRQLNAHHRSLTLRLTELVEGQRALRQEVDDLRRRLGERDRGAR
jgi:hypothetical protein